MSHIPSAAMKHAAPHKEEPQPETRAEKPTPLGDRIGTKTLLAIGGTVLAGAAAAAIYPFVRSRKPAKKPARRKAATRKAASRKSTTQKSAAA